MALTQENGSLTQKREYFSKVHRREIMALPLGVNQPDLLAINVPATFEQGIIPDHEEPPFGLLRILSQVQAEGYSIGIIDAHKTKLSPEEIKQNLEKVKPKMVGLNPTSVNVPEAMVIAQICDELHIPYVVGGVHATIDPEAARLDFPNAYALIKGHGEIAMREVLDRLNGKLYGPVGKGILYFDEPHIDALDYADKMPVESIPLVDQAALVEEPLYKYDTVIRGEKKTLYEVTLDVTDGCPHACGFCCSPLLVGRGRGVKPYDRPSTQHIVDDMEYAVKELGANAFHFLDDMAFVTPKQIHELHAELKKRDLLGKFVWRGMTRANIVNKFDDETMQMLVETGLWKVAIGVESGNDEMLKKISKGIKTEDVLNAVQKLSSYQIESKGFFILGFPDETRMQMEDTISLAFMLKDFGMTEMSMFQFKPYPGTALTLQLIQDHPEILEQLQYLKMYTKGTDTQETGEERARKRTIASVWLPPDVRIAQIPSHEVQSLILQALTGFYGQQHHEQSD